MQKIRAYMAGISDFYLALVKVYFFHDFAADDITLQSGYFVRGEMDLEKK
jgi:hypothetical protein